MEVSQEVQHILGGVSELPVDRRPADAAETLENVLVSFEDGLRKRPGTTSQTLMDASTTNWSNAFVHHVNRGGTTDSDGRYIVVVKGDGSLLVKSHAGLALDVVSPNGLSYLTCPNGPASDLVAYTVGDYTFIVNKTITAKRGSTKAAAKVFEALLFVRQSDFSTEYTVTLQGVTVTMKTVDMAHPQAREKIATDSVASDLKDTMDAHTQLAADFTFTLYGSAVHVTRTDGKDFTISASDGLSDKGLKVIKGQVQAISDLPERAPSGMVVEVVGDPGTTKDNFFVEFDDSLTGADAGVWRECAAPGTPVDFNAATMPHALIRRGKILEGTQPATPPPPTIYSGDETAFYYGFTKDADTATTYSGSQDVVISEHGKGYEAALTASNSTYNQLKVYFDVDTSLVQHGETVEVRLQTNASGAWVDLASKFYAAGVMLQDEYFDEALTLPASTEIRVRGYYGGDETPSLGTRRFRIVLHGDAHPRFDGVKMYRDRATKMIFDTAEVYPKGMVVSFVIDESGNADTISLTLAADKTGTQLATLIYDEITTGGPWVGNYASTTNPTNGEVWIRGTGGGQNYFVGISDMTLTMPALSFWDPDLAMSVNTHVGRAARNLTDGSTGTVTANSATTITVGSLTGGISNAIVAGDKWQLELGTDEFAFDRIAWAERGAGDLDVCPLPSFVDKPIDNIFFHANRLGFLCGENVILSAAGDLFRFTRKTATDLLADDPIDVASAHKDVARFTHTAKWGGGLYLFSPAGHQFELVGSPLTPQTVAIEPRTSYPFANNAGAPAPLVLGDRLIFARTKSTACQVQELYLNVAGNPEAENLTQGVPGYLTGNPLKLAGDDEMGFLFVLASNPQTALYVYRFKFDEDGRRVMGAWSKWAFTSQGGTGTVLSMDFYGGVLTLVMLRTGEGIFLETLDLGNIGTASSTHQDNQTGYPANYTFRWKLSTIYWRNERGQVVNPGRLQIQKLRIRYRDTRAFTVTVTPNGGRSAKTYSYTFASPSSGEKSITISCKNEDVTIEITNTGSTGCAFLSFKWEGEINNGE